MPQLSMTPSVVRLDDQPIRLVNNEAATLVKWITSQYTKKEVNKKINILKTRRGQSGMQLLILGLVALVVASLAGVGPFSVGDADEQPQNRIETGTAATAKVKAVNDANSTREKVATTAYGYASPLNDGAASVENGEQFETTVTTNSDGTTKDMTGFVVGEQAEFICYDSTYDYGVPTNVGDILGENFNVNCETYEGIGSGSVSVTIFDENGAALASGGSVTVGAGETYTFDKVRVRAASADTAINPDMLTVNTTQVESSLENDGITSSADDVSVPNKLGSDFNYAFDYWTEGDLLAGDEPALIDFEDQSGVSVQLNADSDPSGDIQFCVEDSALYQADDDSTAQGVEDQDSNDVGVGQACETVTIS